MHIRGVLSLSLPTWTQHPIKQNAKCMIIMKLSNHDVIVIEVYKILAINDYDEMNDCNLELK